MTPRASLFISYRRTDSEAVLRLCARLRARFGDVRLFLDVEDLAPGQPFEAALQATLAVCTCVLAIIGPRWLAMLRQRAATEAPDYVRLELTAALARRGVLVIPVLLAGSPIPPASQLPIELQALSGRQAFALRPDRFDNDLLQLSEAIADHFTPGRRS